MAGYLTSQKPGGSRVGWSGWHRVRGRAGAARAMGCCQDKDCHTCNEEAKETELEEVKEEGGTRDTRELALERGKVREVGRGG